MHVKTPRIIASANTFRMSTDPKDIGRRLKQAREEAGLSREQVAQRLGVHFTTIQHHENGRNELRPGPAQAYAKLYKRSIGWILTGEGEDTAEIVDIWDHIPPASKPAVRQMLRALTDTSKKESG